MKLPVSGSESIATPTPKLAPVMVLPGAALFPHALLPLYIFEPRYRQMLADTLASDRMFCVAMVRPGAEEEGDDSFFPVTGLGLIRACVTNPDGTLHLVLQGLRRVSIVDLARREPYRLAHLRHLVTSPGDLAENLELARHLVAICAGLAAHTPESAQVQQRLEEVDDPEILADVVAHTFIQEGARRQELLEETVVTRRLRRLIELLA